MNTFVYSNNDGAFYGVCDVLIANTFLSTNYYFLISYVCACLCDAFSYVSLLTIWICSWSHKSRLFCDASWSPCDQLL